MASLKYWAVQLLVWREDKYGLLASGIVGFCSFDRFLLLILPTVSLLERLSYEFSYLPSSFCDGNWSWPPSHILIDSV
jgi:hypothetical protein